MNSSHFRQQILAALMGVVTLTLGDLPLEAATHIPEKLHAEPASARSRSNLKGEVVLPKGVGLERAIAQQSGLAGSDFNNFFQEGRLPSENRLRARSPSNPQIAVDKESKYWQYVIFRAGNCSLWMPPGVMSTENVVLNTDVGKLSFRTLASNADNSRYVAAYAEQLTPAQLANPEVLLRAVRDKVAPSGKFQLKSERAIALSTYPGRELTLQSVDETITFRVYLVQKRLYALGTKYANASSLSKQVAAFLNSFQLLNS